MEECVGGAVHLCGLGVRAGQEACLREAKDFCRLRYITGETNQTDFQLIGVEMEQETREEEGESGSFHIAEGRVISFRRGP